MQQHLSKTHRAKPVTQEIIQYLRGHYDLRKVTLSLDGEESNWFLIKKGEVKPKAHKSSNGHYWRMGLPQSLTPTGFKQSAFPLHRLIYAYHTGDTLESTDVVDHEDPYVCPIAGKDNNPEKLNKMSTRANMMNRKIPSSKLKGTFTGYSWHAKRAKWDVRIKMKGFNDNKVTQFGSFRYEADAYLRRCEVYDCLHRKILDDDNWKAAKGEVGIEPRVDHKDGSILTYGDYGYDWGLSLNEWKNSSRSQLSLYPQVLDKVVEGCLHD